MAAAPATTEPLFRFVGIVDDVTTCERCGKPELKATTVVQPLDAEGNPDGDVLYYGSTCAARALGVKGGARAVRASATGAHHATLVAASEARRRLAAYGLPETGTPDLDAFKAARSVMRTRNPGTNYAQLCAERGVTMTDLVRELFDADRAAIAAAVHVDPRCSFCGTAH